jgi:hypothetical protein
LFRGAELRGVEPDGFDAPDELVEPAGLDELAGPDGLDELIEPD